MSRTPAPEVKLSRIEKMLNAFIYVSRTAVKTGNTSDRYVKVIKDGLAEERDEALEAAAKACEARAKGIATSHSMFAQREAEKCAEAIRALKSTAQWRAEEKKP